MDTSREAALDIWRAAVAAADPFVLVREALAAWKPPTGRILVVGGGKAGAQMAHGAEAALGAVLSHVHGVINIPEGSQVPLRRIELHPARPAASNHPTAEGVAGVERMLALASSAQPGDAALCLLSGGGSALMPSPVEGVSLEEKQHVTRLLHACGADIREMNCVRKHLSRVKGGRLAQAFGGIPVLSLLVSDVVGDPLDVIASGPTAPDPTTYADALEVLARYGLRDKVPSIIAHLEKGGDETLKALPANVSNVVLGNNARSLEAAGYRAGELGWRVLNLGSFIEGETRHVAAVHAGIVRSIRRDRTPLGPPVCLVSGGETTVTLGDGAGKGGRNMEFVLAMLERLGGEMAGLTVLSGGTDGEDGPTDAAGAVADGTTPREGVRDHLARHDAYGFFDKAGGLMRTGLTGTNVMDVRVLLVS